jgi:hypothetical protein
VAHPRVRTGREGDPWDLRAKLEPPRCSTRLEHRWYMSQARGQSVPIAEVVSSYIDDVLRHRRDEATVMVPHRDDGDPVITSAISTIDDEDETSTGATSSEPDESASVPDGEALARVLRVLDLVEHRHREIGAGDRTAPRHP